MSRLLFLQRSMRVLFLSLVLFELTDAHNFLLVSPVFGYSHLKFMSKVGDTLANAGHNVTILQIYNYEHFGKIRMTKNKNIELVDYHDERNAEINENSASAFKFMWDTEIINNPITGALATSSKSSWIKNYTNGFCQRISMGLSLKLLTFVVYILIISIRKINNTCSLSYHHVPAMRTKFGKEQTVTDRVGDIIALPCLEMAFSKLFDKQYNQATNLLKGDVRHWKEILQTATFYFSNGNDYISFPTPFVPKHIRIGGFTIDPPKNLKLDDDYEKILGLRKSTVLISFGTVIQSADMPDSFKDGIIKMFHNLPDITFIWKYEVDDESLSKRLSKNAILRKWVPQPALLGKSLHFRLSDPRLKLFITHGGLGSTLEVAYSGKPALMIPVFGDQLLNAKMLSRHGGAQVYDKYDLADGEKLTEAIREVIENDDFNKNSNLIADLLKNQPIDPKANLLRHVEFSAKFGRISALEPYNVHYNFIQYYMLDAYAVLVLIVLVIVYFVHIMVRFIYGQVFRSKSKKD
ncbi:CRE-UGT-1 protein [Caenorhabditis remanei]|uniref:glucuronosyltransferase n=1 Tax=Caenorhabditis remanei TaxID=31234 RepID=E3MQQ4_CAERE|nr:CRE-UGT-1 protein [Caenorhabditis remanei]